MAKNIKIVSTSIIKAMFIKKIRKSKTFKQNRCQNQNKEENQNQNQNHFHSQILNFVSNYIQL